jgi:hypothetical protein
MTVKRKRRSTKDGDVNLGGRPRLEEQLTITPEMIEIARHVVHGYTPEEIAEMQDCDVNRINKILRNPLVENRIKREMNDRLAISKETRDALHDEAAQSMIRQMRADKVGPTILHDILKRLDPFEILENPVFKPYVTELLRDAGVEAKDLNKPLIEAPKKEEKEKEDFWKPKKVEKEG